MKKLKIRNMELIDQKRLRKEQMKVIFGGYYYSIGGYHNIDGNGACRMQLYCRSIILSCSSSTENCYGKRVGSIQTTIYCDSDILKYYNI